MPQKNWRTIPWSLVSAYFSLFCGPYLTFVVLIPLLPFLEESYLDCRFAVLSFLAPSTTASQEQLSQSTQSVGEPEEPENTQYHHSRDISDKNQSATQLYKNQSATRLWWEAKQSRWVGKMLRLSSGGRKPASLVDTHGWLNYIKFSCAFC